LVSAPKIQMNERQSRLHRSSYCRASQKEKQMSGNDKDDIDRRGALECMIWAGTEAIAAP
jgi:hypothetical protein